MSKIRDSILTTIIIFLCILIIAATIYFCLDVFGIITVPSKYSIASLFYSKIEVIASGESGIDTANIITNITNDISPKVVYLDDKNTVDDSSNSVSMDDLLKKMQSENVTTVETQGEEQTEKFELQENVSSNNFYYEQLDEYGKILYDKLYENMDSFKSGNYTADYGTTFNDLLHTDEGSDVLNNSFQLAINALTFDYPELFYIDVTKIYLITEITTRTFSVKYEVKVGGSQDGASYLSDDFSNTQAVNEAIEKVNTVENNLYDKCKSLSSKIDQMKVIHDYLIDNCEYESSNSSAHDIYGAFIDKKAVCEGYARAFKVMMDKLDIKCIIACGTARNSEDTLERHAWNYVQIDGMWYAIDVTWDDPIVIGNGKVTDSIRYGYFLKGGNKFFEDHFEDGNIVGEANFKYPSLSVLDFKY